MGALLVALYHIDSPVGQLYMGRCVDLCRGIPGTSDALFRVSGRVGWRHVLMQFVSRARFRAQQVNGGATYTWRWTLCSLGGHV